jgi:hypothetical protein
MKYEEFKTIMNQNFNEHIFIACGGVGSRMLDTRLPKCMLPIPIYQSTEEEMILSRTLRLLETDIPITLLTGYRSEMVELAYPHLDTLQTLQADNPGGILTAMKRVFQKYELDSYTFLLGDVIWSEEALEHMMKTRHQSYTTLYHDFRKGFSETYAITVMRQDMNLIYSLLHDHLPSLPPERKVNGNMRTGLRKCRIGHLDQKLRNMGHNHAIVHQIAAVEDVDTEEQYKNLSLCVATGLFDKPARGKEWLALKEKELNDDQ